MRSPLRLLAALGTLVPWCAQAQAALTPGPHAVGYRLLYVHDSTRTAVPDSVAGAAMPRSARQPHAPRVLPVRLWYPAVRTAHSRATMRYGDYLDVRPDGGGAAPGVADSLRDRTMGLLAYVARRYARAGGGAVAASDTAALVERLLATPTRVVRGAAVAAGRFPVVVFAGGAYHSVDENVDLWQQLASRGYLVATIPSVGVDGADLPADDAGLETMTRDVETLIAYLAREPHADRTRLAAVGFSFGGAAALAAAARNRWVGAVAGLDPSFIGRQHTDRVRRAPLFAPTRVRVPVLELHRADTTVDLSVVQSLTRAPRYSVEFTGLDHVDFNSYALRLRPLLPRGSGPAYATRDSAIAAKTAAYVGMVETITDFLAAYVARTGDPAALPAALADGAPRWAGVPGGRVRSRVLPAGETTAGSPPGPDDRR